MSGALMLLLAAMTVAQAAPTERVVETTFGTPAPTYSHASAGPAPTQPWWTTLDDPGLNALLDEAMGNSPAVLAAWERVTVARAGAWQQGSVLMPSAALAGSWARNSTEPTAQQFLNQLRAQNPNAPEDVLRDEVNAFLGDSFDTASVQLQGAWTVDLFGVNTTAYLASRWDAKAMEGNRAAQAMVVAGNVGAAWYDLVAAREQLAFVADQVRVSRELTQLVRLRYEGGAAEALDLLQQQQQLANIEATLPAAEAAVDRASWRLAALLGRNPGAATPEGLDTPDALPTPPSAPSLGTPADLLRRRPDLVASTATLQASDLRRVSAWLGLAPTVQLSGFTGEQGQLFGADAEEWDWVGNWQVGVQATVPLFNGGRRIAAARGASASARAAMLDVQQAALSATAEVEDARRVLLQREQEQAAREAQVEAARQSYTESRTQYLGGIVPYVNVMTALNALQSAELGLIGARRARLTAHITLYNALGAPWALQLDRPAASGGR